MCWQDWAEMFSAALMSELCSEGHFWLFMWTQRNIPQDSHQLDFKRVHFYRSVVSLWPPHHLTSCRLGVPTLSWCLRSQQVESQAVYDINNIPLTTVEATFGDISYLSTSTKQSISSSLFLFFNFSGKKKKKTAHKQIDGMVLFGVSVLWIIEYIFRHSSFFKQNPYWVPPLRYRAGSLLQSPTAPWPQRWRSRRGR